MKESDVEILKNSIDVLYEQRGLIRDYGTNYYNVSKYEIKSLIDIWIKKLKLIN